MTTVTDILTKRQLKRVWGPMVFSGMVSLMQKNLNNGSQKNHRWLFHVVARVRLGAVFSALCSPGEYSTPPTGCALWWPVLYIAEDEEYGWAWCQDQLMQNTRPWRCRLDRLADYGPALGPNVDDDAFDLTMDDASSSHSATTSTCSTSADSAPMTMSSEHVPGLAQNSLGSSWNGMSIEHVPGLAQSSLGSSWNVFSADADSVSSQSLTGFSVVG